MASGREEGAAEGGGAAGGDSKLGAWIAEHARSGDGHYPVRMLSSRDYEAGQADASLIEMHERAMDGFGGGEDGLFESDWVQVSSGSGAKRRAAVLQVVPCSEGDENAVGLSAAVRRDLGVKLDDGVALERVAPGTLRVVKVAPIADTVKGVAGDIASVFLVPFFTSKERCLRKGQLFKARGAMKEVWFVVTEATAADGQDFGIVKPVPGPAGTDLQLMEPVDRAEGEAALTAVGYDDIGGLQKQLRDIREQVELPLRFPKLFRSVGVRPPKGVLLHGPPGTGKTLLARAVANEAGKNFLIINGPEIMSSQGGGPEAELRARFETAEQMAKETGTGAIIFIDEIDSIAPNREKVDDQGMQRVVATLLTLLDGVKGGGQILVLGATNRPNALDPAIRRAGRLDTEILIGVPDREGRLDILKILTRRMKLAEDVKLERLAEVTHGYVGADLGALCSKAAVHCVKRSARGLLDMDEEDIPAEFLDRLAISMADFVAGMDLVQLSALREVAVETPDVSFDDIGGLEDVKQAVREMIELPVDHPEEFEAMGLRPPSGALLYGPPGCGKTLIAKAIANECQANFIAIKGPQLLSKWYGESEENVRDIFTKARQASPCVLFFDELDAVATIRGGASGSAAGGAGDRVVNQLLTELDGVGERKNVFVIGATNRPSLLDQALTRPGRLDQMIYVPVPDFDARRSILKALLRKTRVSRDADIERIAEETDGFNGADLAGIVQLACKISVRRRLEEMTRVCDLLMEGGSSKKTAIKAAREATTDWAVTHDCFERARAAAKRSVSETDLAAYNRMRAEVEGHVDGGDGYVPAVPIPDFGAAEAAASASAAASSTDAGAAGDTDLY